MSSKLVSSCFAETRVAPINPTTWSWISDLVGFECSADEVADADAPVLVAEGQLPEDQVEGAKDEKVLQADVDDVATLGSDDQRLVAAEDDGLVLVWSVVGQVDARAKVLLTKPASKKKEKVVLSLILFLVFNAPSRLRSRECMGVRASRASIYAAT
ncbi:hypothetical protein MBM_08662 [Drepanopeziza brunnea f. sp. 'multigermtubi' MB_m1]|uniref:Uncharacterized protein n=1 Tax=Marssonina brunnea f. sp. multigermtubi (strain MB_m1) TaxID=1072389 RepID=K1XL95_MARBU|nr:uncharacterized protein MBM_08662 [Drepanopeziza brunnea f. sp. 'multigermtubi' MB_m1]EKD13219.1 hypothetical protein MBM_08662 [Drepanopeziza brunnea f. sp. 'multigermtubi' MB_m1]